LEVDDVSESSLYEQLGGEQAIAATVGMFYDKIMNDAALSPFFAGLDMDKLVHKQIAFMTMAFGGPHEYDGRALRDAHARLVTQGLGHDHFLRVAGHLQSTLETLAVPSELIGQVMTIVGSTEGEVLGR
jgi:hemoglobin